MSDEEFVDENQSPKEESIDFSKYLVQASTLYKAKKYREAYPYYKTLYEHKQLNGIREINEYLTCCKRLRIREAEPIFVEAYNRTEDLHIKRNYAEFLTDVLAEHEKALTLINEILDSKESRLANDFLAFDIKGKIFANLGSLKDVMTVFETKLSKLETTNRNINQTKSELEFTFRKYLDCMSRFFLDVEIIKRKEANDMVYIDTIAKALARSQQLLSYDVLRINEKGKYTHRIFRCIEIIDPPSLRPTLLKPINRNKIFISYSHRDKNLVGEFLGFLKNEFRENADIQIWVDAKDIPVGTSIEGKVTEGLNSTRVAVLFVSNDYLVSNFIQTKELNHLLDLDEKREVRLIPVYLRHCRFSENVKIHQRLNRLLFWPKLDEPVAGINDLFKREKIWCDLVGVIVDELRKEL